MEKKEIMNVGIIGAGRIAAKAAATLKEMKYCRAYGIGSRTLEKAASFAKQWDIPKFYGSYRELIEDPDVDLIYVATPHSHHYEVTKEALMAGKPCLVEKAFMANFREAKEIVELAKKKHVFLAEAIWTRYQPAVDLVRKIIDEGKIGEPKLITATLTYELSDKERLFRPVLCGGALLDLGVYVINFVRMFFDAKIVGIDGSCIKSESGVDITNAITMNLDNKILANLQSSSVCVGDNTGVIAGTKGNIIIDNVNNPGRITVNGADNVLKEEFTVPSQITGYEYQFEVCRRCLIEGKIEPKEMPWDEILYVMQIMDDLRKKWGVKYPMD